MSRIYTATILLYDDKRGQSGKLLGIVTFSDGKSLKVWDDALHRLCKHLEQFTGCDVSYAFKHSDRWGDSLETITPVKADHELYSDARLADEALGRSHKQGGFIAEQISRQVQKSVDTERKAGQ